MQTRNILLLPFLSGLAAAQSSTDVGGSSSGSAVVDPTSSSSSPSAAAATTTAAPAMSSSFITSSPASWTYYNTTVVSTVVVAELTTVCEGPATTFTFNDCVYPVTQGQTLVVTNCPCTITTTVPTMTSELCTRPAAAATGGAVAGGESSSSKPTGGAMVPPGNNEASPGMPSAGEAGGSSSPVYVAPSSPTAMPSAVQVAGASHQKKSLAGLAVAVVGIFALGRL